MSHIQPLRIQKSSLSPDKMTNAPTHRPLAELSPSERRRNSPSYNQVTKKPLFQADSSPFDSSPFTNSPRLYWHSRDPGSPTRNNAENRDPRDRSPSPAKRSSIENLKRASRVKNSNMFAREQKNEYDPMASPMIERPLASGRSFNAQKNGAKSFEAGAAQENGGEPSLRSPAKMAGRASMPNPAAPPTKKTHSPSKSSFSSKSRYAQAQAFDPESGIWSDEEDSITDRQLPPGKSLHRHAKSVTFDVAPPQINEYEMTTPDPSSVASGSREGSHDSTEEEDESFDRGSSIDREDSFDPSLEDVEKTPVVLPEDWRFMSPDSANEELTARFEDPFAGIHGSPQPTTQASMAVDARLTPIRTDSADSNGERRPLPPLPPSGLPHSSHKRTDSRNNLSATVERFDSAQHSAATPPGPASVTKSEIQGMSGCAMSLEERLKLMMLDDEKSPKDQADEQRERRLRRGSPARNIPSQIASQSPDHKDELEGDDIAELEDYSLPPRISRESILRNVRDKAKEQKAQDERTSSSLTLRFGNDISSIDPDVPLPTTEDTDGPQSFIKQELDEQSEVDVYAIPDLYSEHLQTESFVSAMDKLEAIKKSQEQETWDSIGSEKDDDEESQYSVDSKPDAHVDQQSVPLEEDEGPPTPKISDNQLQPDRKENHRMSLPQFAALLGNRDFDFGMESFMSDAPHSPAENYKAQANITSSWESAYSKGVIERKAEIERPNTPEMQLNPPKLPAYDSGSFEEAGTPDSVVRHKISNSPPEPPSVPALAATIKSSNGKLKTRQSATPTDLQAMAMVRRQVSGEESEVPAVPKIPFEHQSQPSAEQPEQVSAGVKTEGNLSQTNAIVDEARQPKRKSSLTPLDLRVEREEGLGIESEFDRLIEAQKVEYLSRDLTLQAPYWSPGYAEYMGGQGFRPTEDFGANRSSRTQKGYLMRQNTKVIVASSASHDSDVDPKDVKDGLSTDVRGTRSAGNSPRKGSHTTWTTEPWNGKVRRKSIRKSGGLPSKPAAGPAPPLPGQQSNVASSLDSVDEDEALGQVEEIGEDGERGRLFVKVVRVKDLDLPLPRGERSYFALTLDNGLHCVTTSWLELGKTAPIGQEFELVVLNDLEFQLTLQTKIEEPQPKPVLESPTKAAKAAKSSAFSRVFASPRKRKEMELKQQEEAQRADRQRQQDLQASKRAAQPTAWELLHNLVAQDGSFARAYVCLKDHESSAYGKQFTVDVPCFNEWATEESHNGSSARSKRTGAILRKAPYRVGKLELHLFYVPKPKGSSDEEMPKSMSGCIRELREAQQAGPTKWEGHLSQQGGDCPYWRRRFFSLDGSKFTAYHEATRQPRATINLAKASKLIDDKSALMKTGKGSRRKSAFAEEEEGYMFVEEGFRIRFGNGETIDFYADSAADKEGWMKALSEVVGKDMRNKKWTDLVIERHRAVASRAQQAMDGRIKPLSPTKPMPPPASTKLAPPVKSAPPTPAKTFTPKQPPFGVPEKSPRRSDFAITNRRAEAASKTRSMIF